MRRAILSLLLTLPLGACLPDPADRDGDGHDEVADCDDRDASVHPGAVEVCDGLDNDCDGEVDEGLATTWYADADADGFGDPAAPVEDCAYPAGTVASGTDCDDGDATVHPGATETCDGVDQDCDGTVDEGLTESRFQDADGDGHGDPDAPVAACTDTTGTAASGDDCDDTDPAVHPGAEDAWYDGVDADCDGASDHDADTDGWDAASGGGDDCDDADGSVHPGAADTCGDGVDADCDGVDPACGPWGELSLADADARFLAEGANDFAGRAVAGGDLDGDGRADLLITAKNHDTGGTNSGAAYVFHGPVSGDVDLGTADAKIVGEDPSDELGDSVAAAGDVDGDGHADLVVGAYSDTAFGPQNGAAWLVPGPFSGEIRLADEGFKMEGYVFQGAGYSVAGGGDVDGDGYDDLLIGSWDVSYKWDTPGYAWLVRGPVTGDLELASDADAQFTGEGLNHYAGAAVAMAGDVDGDGLEDLLIGAWGAGAAYLVLGPASGSMVLSAADARLQGEGGYAAQAVAGAGDVDGDGYADLLVGAPATRDAGVAWLVLGPVSGDVSLAGADAVLVGEDREDYAGCAVSAAGDVNGDGRADLLVGAPFDDSVGASTGAAYVVLAPVSGEVDLADADLKCVGETVGDMAGASLAGVGDTNADGYDDILIGAPYWGSADATGRAYLVLGAPE